MEKLQNSNHDQPVGIRKGLKSQAFAFNIINRNFKVYWVRDLQYTLYEKKFCKNFVVGDI